MILFHLFSGTTHWYINLPANDWNQGAIVRRLSDGKLWTVGQRYDGVTDVPSVNGIAFTSGKAEDFELVRRTGIA